MPPEPRKLPRISLEKARSDVPADRRKAVAVFGDALRDGACRILVPDEEPTTPESMAAVGRELLELLEEYFGLEAGCLVAIAVPTRARDPESQARGLLSLCVAGAGDRPPDLVTAGGRQGLAIRLGEWLACPGPGLETLTSGVVPASEVSVNDPGDAMLVLAASPAVALRSRSEFVEADARNAG